MTCANQPAREPAAAEPNPAFTLFGLIEEKEASEELHGYEVTLSGRLVLPRLHPIEEESFA